jgi:protein-disulfide isomerase
MKSPNALAVVIASTVAGFVGGFAAQHLDLGAETRRQEMANLLTGSRQAELAEIQSRLPQMLVAENDRIQANFRKIQEDQRAIESAAAAAALKDALPTFAKDSLPVFGNANGTRTLYAVEDLACGFCKVMHTAVKAALAADPDLRVVVLPVGFLGPNSVGAATAILTLQSIAPAAANSAIEEIYVRNHPIDGENLARLVLAKLAEAGISPETYQAAAITRGQVAFEAVEVAVRKAGVRGTPFFILPDGKAQSGASPQDAFLKALGVPGS